jgi:hypothetical protein
MNCVCKRGVSEYPVLSVNRSLSLITLEPLSHEFGRNFTRDQIELGFNTQDAKPTAGMLHRSVLLGTVLRRTVPYGTLSHLPC